MKQGASSSDLLILIFLAILFGIIGGWYMPHWLIRVFLTFNGLFSQFLGFMVPLLIVGLVAPGVADSGKGSGRLVLYTVGLSYAFMIFAGVFTYGASILSYPYILQASPSSIAALNMPQELSLYFNISIPPMMNVTTALMLALVLGLGVAYVPGQALKNLLFELRMIVYKVLYSVIIPLLPLYVFGVFMNMTVNGQVTSVLTVFLKVIVFLFVLTLLVLLIQFVIAGFIADKKPLDMLKAMFPAYVTGLGTASSAATIPVTYRQVQTMGVKESIAGFTVPLCSSIHMPGSMVKMVGFAVAILWLTDGSFDNWHLMLGFICMVGVAIMAGPGVPGGAMVASIGVLQQVLGFNEQMLELMIVLYIALDSFGTACNVAGDGAISVIINKLDEAK